MYNFLCLYLYALYMYMCVYIYVCVCLYIYIMTASLESVLSADITTFVFRCLYSLLLKDCVNSICIHIQLCVDNCI
jgi:hypothetical protein